MKSYVTLEQQMCPVCGVTHETGSILMDMRLKDTFEHHTTTGYGMCKPCTKLRDDGYIALIGVDPKKSTISDANAAVAKLTMEHAHRTGDLIHIRKEVCEQFFNIDITTNPFMFVEDAVIKKLIEMQKNSEDE